MGSSVSCGLRSAPPGVPDAASSPITIYLRAMNTPAVDDVRAGRDGQRVAHILIIAVAVVFIGASAIQIVPAVFGAGVRPVGSAGAGSTEDPCTDGVRSLAIAIHRAGALAWSPSAEGAPPPDVTLRAKPFKRGCSRSGAPKQRSSERAPSRRRGSTRGPPSCDFAGARSRPSCAGSSRSFRCGATSRRTYRRTCAKKSPR